MASWSPVTPRSGFAGKRWSSESAWSHAGEVGLIFARIGLDSGVFDAGLFGAVTLMVIVTTLVAPIWLKRLLGPVASTDDVQSDVEAIEELVAEP